MYDRKKKKKSVTNNKKKKTELSQAIFIVFQLSTM